MKIKWGALVVDGRGKIGGQVASKNRSGAFLRNKVTPVNAQTDNQVLARSRLAQFSSGWNGLSQDARDAWNAATEQWQNTNIFGDLRKPTGKNLYTRLNSVLASIGEAALTMPPMPGDVVELVDLAVQIDLGSEGWEVQAGNTNEDMSYQLWATSPHSPGRNFVGGRFRQIGTLSDTDLSSGYDFKADYEARFGAPQEGQAVTVRVIPVITATGQKGQGLKNKAIVTDSGPA